tara:strand:+ start:2087 stop:2923 length:837 start_codon:yes stop_codon:yes gene_type:complete
MIIWLSSYPKSGNTWVRSFLNSLLYIDNHSSDINDLKIRSFPNRKDLINLTTNIEDINDIIKHTLSAQSYLNQDKKIKFLKTHSANWRSNKYSFTDEKNTSSVIYIVRDPRNIVTSINNHFSFNNIEKALDFMKDENKVIGNKNSKNEVDILTVLSSWSNHYKSWKKIEKQYLLIKYENLLNNPKNEFQKITNFLIKNHKFKINENEIVKSIENNNFENLRKQERLNGFGEAVKNKNGEPKTFFNLGPSNNWETILDPKIRQEIEKSFQNEMEELGYL